MDALKLKTVLSLLIIVVGALAVPFFATEAKAPQPQASGFLIDFGDWNVTWTEMDMQKNSDPYEALDTACQDNNFTSTVGDDGTVTEINGVSADDTHTWDLWTISNNSLTWVKQSNPQNVNLSGFTIAAWAYNDSKSLPTVAVDGTGRSIYGYPQAQRTITLSPAMTGIVGSLRAVDTLVGTDLYSTYPDSVVAGQNSGKIKILGDYLNPSFEQIVAQKPDIVFCDGSLYSHQIMAEKLRGVNINAILMYGGDSIQTILDNIYIAGEVMRYNLTATDVISSIENAENEIIGELTASTSTKDVNVMVALSPDKAPWVTGSDTYVDDLTTAAMGNNVFQSQYQWVMINSEQVIAANPSVIILLTVDYSATQGDYNAMMNSLPAEWRTTDAYKTGNIYMVCGSAGDMSETPSPRFIQLMELTARILHPDVFSDIELPKFIGDNYEDFLTFTKNLDFNY